MGEFSKVLFTSLSLVAVLCVICLNYMQTFHHTQLRRSVEEFDIKEIVEEKELRNHWEMYEKVVEGTNCSADLKLFGEDSTHPRVAISSFPGSGNTWARHLLHMGSGFWTGNRRSSKTLKAAGWLAEDLDCLARRTIAQKTHRLSNNKACEFERGVVLIRNPFDAILAAYNHHKAGKTGEPSLSVFEGEDWPRFVKAYANSWLRFHTEWFTSFQGPITVSCFTDLVKDPVSEVSRWLKAMDFDDRRVGCINHDPVGQFYRQKTKDYSHLYGPQEVEIVKEKISLLSDMLKNANQTDCTESFSYSKCC